MDITIHPRPLRGDITIIPSKSQAHRLLICAALSDNPTQLRCAAASRDMDATADCLRALGAQILRTDSGYTVFPMGDIPKSAVLACHDSGSTLRFLLPIVGALGVDATFHMEGRLPQRPLSPLWEEMERMGCHLSRPTPDSIRCTGKLQAGAYSIPGNISSQYVTGLLFALSLIPGETSLQITGELQSRPYVEMTRQAMALFQAPRYHSPGTVSVEGDWSNGAFFVAANAMGNEITIHDLDADSAQGDKAIVFLLKEIDAGSPCISAANIPDLVPILSIAAAAKQGAVFTDIARLRLKESDRVESILAMIHNLGGRAQATENTMTICGTGLRGGCVDAMNDHRIAMAAAIGATICKQDVTILDAQCVEKSYPKFWAEYRTLGGNYEQYLR